MSVPEDRVGKLAKLTVLFGAGVLLFGFFGLLFIDEARTNPPEFFKWFGGGVLVHDALLVPVVAVIAAVATRFVPPFMKAPVQGAFFASTILALTTLPFWRGYGLREDNPSALPNDYGAAVVSLVAAIWALAAVWSLIRWRKR